MSRIAAALLALVFVIAAELRAQPPNVVVILCDDLGYGDVGAYGQQRIKTPNLDRFAREGLRFTQHYAGSAVCAPSRACLLTGQHTGHTVVRGNPGSAVKSAPGDTALPADTLTFAKLFKQAGYQTAIIGKWGMGHPGTSGDPAKQGFGHFFGYAGHKDAHEYYPPHLWRNGEKVPLDGKQYAHDLITDEAVKWVESATPKPFMLFLTFTTPHSKLQVPDKGHYGRESWPESEKKFAAMISRMDASVGRLMETLKRLRIDDKTLVIFSSDNGPHTEGGHDPTFFDSNGPLRGIKRDLYEGGIRVPFVARWPGKIAANATTDHVAAFWDFLPTCAELLGTAPPQTSDGASFLPTLLGQPDRQAKHEHLYWEFQERGGKQAVRFGDWKAVRLNVSTAPSPLLELYDLASDPAEANDVAAKHPAEVKRAEELLKREHQPSKLFPLLPEELEEGAGPARPKRRRNR